MPVLIVQIFSVQTAAFSAPRGARKTMSYINISNNFLEWAGRDDVHRRRRGELTARPRLP